MKNIERGSKKYLIFLIVSVAICGIILYPLFDLIFCKFITNSDFNYSVIRHVIDPVVFAFIYGITIWILDKKKK